MLRINKQEQKITKTLTLYSLEPIPRGVYINEHDPNLLNGRRRIFVADYCLDGLLCLLEEYRDNNKK